MKYLTMLICMLFLCTSITIVSAIDVSRCGALGTADETYTMTANVSTNETTCFIITATDITLDCNGFFIIVNNDFDTIDIYTDQPNTIIKNCNIATSTSDNIIGDSKDIKSPKKALFDIVSETVSEPKKPGEDLIIKISLINFGASSDTVDANLEYTISDSHGETIRQYNKIMPVTTQIEFLDRINTTGMVNGKYKLKIELIYIGQTFPASTEKIFYVGSLNVVSLKGLLKNTSVKAVLFSIITIVLLVGVYRKSRINKSKESADNHTNISVEKLSDYKVQ